jgi:hypothetical protein
LATKPGEHKAVQARILASAQEIGRAYVPRGSGKAARFPLPEARFAGTIHGWTPSHERERKMPAHVLRGTKQEIADRLARIPGEVREAIVFVEEPPLPLSPAPAPGAEDIFAEMRPYLVDARDVDDSREAIYTRTEGE